jgi:hypothetical protein
MVATEVALPGSAEVVPATFLSIIQVAEMAEVQAVHRIKWAYTPAMAPPAIKVAVEGVLVPPLPSVYLDGAALAAMGSVWSSPYKT